MLKFLAFISFLFLFTSCSHFDKKKATDEKVDVHTTVVNDSIGQVIRVDSFKSQLRKENKHNPLDSSKK